MYALKLSLLLAAATLLACSKAVEARPPIRQRPMNDEVACDRVEKYTTEWFLANTKPEFRNNIVDNALFYSQGMSTRARRFAKSNGTLTTIWDVWPCYLYNLHHTPNNPLRCVHADTKHQLHFFENMSRAFALKAKSFATVMHSTQNFANPPKSGIWARVEWPALQLGLVESIEKINENRSLAQICWRYLKEEFKTAVLRPGIMRDFRHELFGVGGGFDKVHRDLVKRDIPGPDICWSDKELEKFDKVDW